MYAGEKVVVCDIDTHAKHTAFICPPSVPPASKQWSTFNIQSQSSVMLAAVSSCCSLRVPGANPKELSSHNGSECECGCSIGKNVRGLLGRSLISLMMIVRTCEYVVQRVPDLLPAGHRCLDLKATRRRVSAGKSITRPFN